ncbi:MAG: branched-chain amino acid transaminase [Myxococcota bacterium]
MVNKSKTIWMDGEMIPWEEANVHVMTHSLHYGVGVFEGIRCYTRTDGRRAIFRLREHIRRLLDSAKIATMDVPYDIETLCEACIELVRVNGLDSCYLRPIIFMGDGVMGLGAMNVPIRTAIIAWDWGAYLGDEGLQNGIRTKISSFTRGGVNSVMARAKMTGQYVNSVLAKREALMSGYDEAILLDAQGFVSEGSGENIFAIRDGEIRTTPTASSILAGITRDTVITILEETGAKLVKGRMTRDDLYISDELFLTGTAAEITPIRSVDNRAIGMGKPGPVTKRVQERYFDLVRGSSTDHMEWLAFVD